jgi:hypothetical protein
MAMAKADGWTMRWDKKLNKKVPAEKYVSMPEHMLKWRSAAFLIRLYAPETMMGIRTVEEIEDSISEMRDITPPRPTIDDFKPGATMATETPESVDSPSDVLATAQTVADQGWEALRLWWRTLSENNRDILQANVDDLIACARAVDAQRATESVGSGTSSEGGGADTDDEGTSTDVQPPSETNPAPAPEPRPARPPRVTPTRAQAGARTPPQEVVREQLQASVAATEPPTSEEALASGKYFSRERALAADEPFALTAPQQVQRSAEFTRLTEYMQMETTRAGLEQWRAMNERDISGLRGYEDRDFWQDYQERLERMP